MNDRLLRACRREPVDRTPVWIMRQAGRYLKEYREIRQNIPFLELCQNTDLAAEVSLQPYRILDVDAVILFSDILIPVQAMGLSVSITDRGPEIADPIRSETDLKALHIPDPASELSFVGSILKKLRGELVNEVPLIGFGGAPWTLATYMIQGGSSKNFDIVKGIAYREPRLIHGLLDKLASTVAAFLLYQIESGAQVIQLFDTWAGDLNRSDYEEFALPYTQKIFEAIGQRVPRILYVNGCSAILESTAKSGADVLSIDWRVSIGEAKHRIGARLALQGNLDPAVLLGPEHRMLDKARQILQQAGPRGHIMNLGHGILPSTPVANAQSFIRFSKTYQHES